MHRLLTAAAVIGLAACGPSGIVSSGGDASESDSSESGDGEPGDGDGDEVGDGDGDGDGDEPDLPPDECETVIDGSVYLFENSVPAYIAGLSCVEEITGDLVLDGAIVGDLAFLSSLVRVGGRVTIGSSNALLDLTGLDALEEIGGSLSIGHNASLLSLDGLGSLHSMHGLDVSGNSSLTSVAGLSGALHLHAAGDAAHVELRFTSNSALTSLDELAAITELTVELPLWLEIADNEQLGGDLFGLSNLVHDEQQLDLVITNNALDSLVGLEALTTAVDVTLFGPGGQFTSLVGLDNLTTVTGELLIGQCQTGGCEVSSECGTDYSLELLESLDGLESLVEVGSLYIWGNESLADIDGLSNLASAGDVTISGNPVLPAMAVTDLFAGVEITGMFTADMNGEGIVPECGQPPPP